MTIESTRINKFNVDVTNVNGQPASMTPDSRPLAVRTVALARAVLASSIEQSK